MPDCYFFVVEDKLSITVIALLYSNESNFLVMTFRLVIQLLNANVFISIFNKNGNVFKLYGLCALLFKTYIFMLKKYLWQIKQYTVHQLWENYHLYHRPRCHRRV